MKFDQVQIFYRYTFLVNGHTLWQRIYGPPDVDSNTQAGKSRDYREYIVFWKALFSKCFLSTRKPKAGVFKFLQFEKRFRDGLVWMVGLTAEIKPSFQISPVYCGCHLKLLILPTLLLQYVCNLTSSASMHPSDAALYIGVSSLLSLAPISAPWLRRLLIVSKWFLLAAINNGVSLSLSRHSMKAPLK